MKRFFSPSWPFEPKRVPFFYGWIVVVVSTLGVLMSIPGQTIGVSVFTDFLIDALGLSRVQLSVAYMLGTISSSLFLPWSGRVFDRVGARVMVVVSSLILAGILFLLSQCDTIARFLSFGVEEGITLHFLRFELTIMVRVWMAFFIIYLGFFLLRFSGQGMLTLCSRSMLAKWFQKKRGLVAGINGVVVTVFFCLAPVMYDWLIGATDWRMAWMISGGMAVGMAILGWLLYRDNPEECGLTMDGAATEPDASGDDSENSGQEDIPVTENDYTVYEARRTYSFWVFNLGLASYALIITALTFHIVSVGEQVGLSREQALKIFIPMAYVSIFCNFIFGWLSDRFALKYLLMLMMAVMVMGIVSLPFFVHPIAQAAVIIGFGATGGFFSPLMTVIWPTFFGRKHLGAISGLNMSSCVFGSALGPFIFGWSYDVLGSYQPGIAVCAVMPLLIFLLAIKADPPKR